MRTFIFAGLFGIASITGSLAEQDTTSARYHLDGCRSFSRNNDNANMFMQGQCSGVIKGILYYQKNKSICPPNGVTNAQYAAVIVRFTENNPQRWHHFILDVAEDALEAAWPCRR